jgi:signal peptidase I
MTDAPIETERTQRRPAWWQIVLVGRNPRFTVVRIAVTVLLAWLVFGEILRPIKVAGPSMEPTYRFGQINFVNRWSFKFHPPARGDVVGVRMAGESVIYLKRIVGLPGERIRFRRGKVYINDEPLDEPYVRNPAPWNEAEMQLGPDEYFIVGDNRTMPARDHTHGAFRRSDLIGRVLL